MKFRKLLIIRNKPALYCAVFILYLFFGITSNLDGAGTAFGTLHIIASVAFLAFRRPDGEFFKTFGMILFASAFGLFWSLAAKYVYYYPSQRFIDKYAGGEREMVIRIDKVDSYGNAYANYNCSVLLCEGVETENVFGVYPSLRLSCFGGDFAQKGDVVAVKGEITLPEVETASGFEEEKYLKSRHIFMSCDYNGTMTLLEKGSESGFDRVRDRLLDNITKYVGNSVGDETAVARCMLLGDKTLVTKQLKETFRAAGISHVLSVSGLHLSILFMTVSALFGLGKRSPRRNFVYAEAVSCFFVLLYMALADFTPSIMRAGFMLIFMNLYSVVSFYKRRLSGFRKVKEVPLGEAGIVTDDGSYNVKSSQRFVGAFNSVSALFCAGAMILIISPYSLYDVGIQLSFMSTLGILVVVWVFGFFDNKRLNPIIRAVLTSLLITLSAVSFTLPICIYNFGSLSTVSFISNLIVTPVMTPLLAILLVLALISLLPEIGVVTTVCVFLGQISEILCGFCIRVAKFIGGLSFSVIPARESIVLVVVFMLYVVFTVVCLFLGLKRLCAVGCLSVMCLYFVYMGISFSAFLSDFSEPYVNFCTVGTRPYFCIAVRDERIFFDDASGIASDSIIRKSLGESFYQTDNIYVVVPNGDADFDSVLFNIGYLDKSEKIKAVLLPSDQMCESAGVNLDGYGEFIRELSEKGFNIVYYGSEFNACGIEFKAAAENCFSGFIFNDVSVIFAYSYDEEYADKFSAGSKACIYFCQSADKTDNLGYKSEAQLFVSSHVHTNVRGANAIPVRKPAVLEK